MLFVVIYRCETCTVVLFVVIYRCERRKLSNLMSVGMAVGITMTIAVIMIVEIIRFNEGWHGGWHYYDYSGDNDRGNYQIQ